MNFLDPKTIEKWTGKKRRDAQRRQLENWGFKQATKRNPKGDFWIRSDSSLAVKAELLQSIEDAQEVTGPDWTSLNATPQTNKPTPSTARLHQAR